MQPTLSELLPEHLHEVFHQAVWERQLIRRSAFEISTKLSESTMQGWQDAELVDASQRSMGTALVRTLEKDELEKLLEALESTPEPTVEHELRSLQALHPECPLNLDALPDYLVVRESE